MGRGGCEFERSWRRSRWWAVIGSDDDACLGEVVGHDPGYANDQEADRMTGCVEGAVPRVGRNPDGVAGMRGGDDF
jgi:hypothetical protein